AWPDMPLSVRRERGAGHRRGPHGTRTTPARRAVRWRPHMKPAAALPFGAQLKALRESAGFTQEELATIAGLSVHAVSAIERGERRRPHVETVRALSAALDVNGAARDALLASARAPAQDAAADGLGGV